MNNLGKNCETAKRLLDDLVLLSLEQHKTAVELQNILRDWSSSLKNLIKEMEK